MKSKDLKNSEELETTTIDSENQKTAEAADLEVNETELAGEEEKSKVDELVDSLEEKASKLKSFFIDKVEEVLENEKVAEGKAKLDEIVNKVSEKIADAKIEAKEIIAEAKEDFAEVIDDSKEEIAEGKAKFSEFADKVSEKIEDVKAEVAEKVAEVKSKVADIIEDNKEEIAEGKSKFSEFADKVSEKIDDVKAEVAEKVTEVKSKVADIIEDNKEEIAEGKSKFSEFADKVSEKIDDVKAEVAEKVAKAKSKVADIIEDNKEEIAESKAKIVEIADKVSAKITEVTEPVTEKVEELLEKAKTTFVGGSTIDNAPAGFVEIDDNQSKEEIEDVKANLNETIEKASAVIAEVVEPETENNEITDEQSDEENKERIDYSLLSPIELVNVLRDLLDQSDDVDIRADVEVIKSIFYKQHHESVESARAAFISEGGNEEEFVIEEDPYENDIKELLKVYGTLRKEHNKQLDSEKDENYEKKLEIIERIKGLINNEESINRTFNEFRDLQYQWREIGPVPQAKMKNLWDTYHFHVENFYDYIKINRELRDLDLKRNLEHKIELCENAEELMVEPNILKAFNTLQKYHEQWREIGPVPRENKDDVWERFKLVTSKINKKHQEFFESKKSEQKNNYDAKIALCEKVEEIVAADIESFKDWDQKSKELVELQKVWRTIGFAPKKDNNKIYDRFREACDSFFNKKRDFYSKNKEFQQNNLQLKIDLCMQAEELRENTDWKKATQDFINIQKKWKEIGPVPRKHSDIIWKRFRAACDFFFDKKSEHFSDIDTEQSDNLQMKEALIAELENFKPSENSEDNLKMLKDIQRRWSEIGHVPFKKKDAVHNRFRDEISKLFDQLSINEERRNLMRFKTKMTNFSETQRGQSKMRMEREKYMNKLKQLENDLVLLDNNIGFFAKSKNADALIEDVKRKIDDTRLRIEELKEKIRVIDEMED